MTPEQHRARLEFIYKGADVLRFHTTPPLRPQTDGQHSFGVAWWCWLLTDGTCSVNLIMAALAHDLAEQVTGDMPAMVKRQATIGVQLEAIEVEARRAAGLEFHLTAEEQHTLDTADAYDGMMFCVAERRLGNRTAELWYGRWKSWLLPRVNGAEGIWLDLIDTLMTEVILRARL